LCLSRAAIMLLLALFCVLAGAAALLLVKSAEAAKKLQYFNALRKDNENMTKENEQLRLVYQKAEQIDSFALYLEKLSSISQAQVKTKITNKTNEAKTGIKAADTSKTTKLNQSAFEKTGVVMDSGGGSDKNENAEYVNKFIPSVLPVEGWITQQFVDDTTMGIVGHPGIDIAAAEGMAIKAPAAGVVLSIGNDQYYGNLIVIKHGEEFTTRYGHCAKIFLSEGEKVERGQTLALVGNTGHSTAPHLHYEVIRNGKNINPLLYVTTKK